MRWKTEGLRYCTPRPAWIQDLCWEICYDSDGFCLISDWFFSNTLHILLSWISEMLTIVSLLNLGFVLFGLFLYILIIANCRSSCLTYQSVKLFSLLEKFSAMTFINSIVTCYVSSPSFSQVLINLVISLAILWLTSPGPLILWRNHNQTQCCLRAWYSGPTMAHSAAYTLNLFHSPLDSGLNLFHGVHLLPRVDTYGFYHFPELLYFSSCVCSTAPNPVFDDGHHPCSCSGSYVIWFLSGAPWICSLTSPVATSESGWLLPHGSTSLPSGFATEELEVWGWRLLKCTCIFYCVFQFIPGLLLGNCLWWVIVLLYC